MRTMEDINIRFKDMPPEETVEKIQGILKSLGITLEEKWTDSGIENCCSVHVYVNGVYPFFTNGKGVSKALARASAYGEFIERLQCGLFLYKFQSITRDFGMNLQSYAPDGKYMTMAELEESGEWMDYVIQTYGNSLTKKKLAEQCRVYACTDEDKIWTIPFYSLFEKKYVYLPAGFVEHIYSANGCCAGNTREEAWVHALSEMMERRSTITMLTGGKSAPVIPEEVIRRYPVASKILDTIRASGRYDIRIFDFSLGTGLPVVATRIIDKKNHGYIVNISAEPVLEIAIDRTLTEIFQGRKLDTFGSLHDGGTLEECGPIPVAHNVLNQIENGNGVFSLDFFTEELSGTPEFVEFADHRGKNNQQLLEYMLDLYRKLNRPVYVRNNSFLGFPCYQFVVPGFSETRGLRLIEPVCEYALGDAVQKAFRNVAEADVSELMMMLTFHKKISTAFSRKHNFRGLAGLPMSNTHNRDLMAITLSCAAYRLGRYAAARSYLAGAMGERSVEPQDKSYFRCIDRYLSLKGAGVADDRIRLILEKFYEEQTVEKLYGCLDSGKTPHDPYLVKCDTEKCADCRYRADCAYAQTRHIIAAAGERYRSFTDGQSEAHFAI